MAAGMLVARQLSPTRRGAGKGSLNVRQPSKFPITCYATIESRRIAMARFAPPTGLLSAAALAATAWAAPAPGQGLDIRTLFNAPGANTAGAPAPTAGVQDWSGESGASNHPLMTAQAIRAAAANFRNCLAGLWPLAERRGVSRAVFEANVAGLTPDLRIMDLLDAQPEFTKSFWDYLDILVNEDRIQNGRAVIRSTATLACVGRRQDYFREEFLSALEILARGDVKADHLKGSWAGAFGPTQFMPTSFKRYAVDFDGDGRRDVVDSVPDVIASTANNLKMDGWIAGQPWGYEVVLPAGFDYLLADRSRQMTLRQWESLGVRRAGGGSFREPDARAYLLLPGGARGPAFLMLQNVRVIMKYNPAEAYALAIGHLADRLRGGGPLVQTWRRDQRVLTRSERYELQQLLAQRGYD